MTGEEEKFCEIDKTKKGYARFGMDPKSEWKARVQTYLCVKMVKKDCFRKCIISQGYAQI